MAIKDDIRSNILMVDKDWGSTVLWGRTSHSSGMTNYTSYRWLALPQWLIDRMDYWSAWYESFESDDIKHRFDWEAFRAYGLSIAIDLKRIVGDKFVVYYGTQDEIEVWNFNPQYLPPRND